MAEALGEGFLQVHIRNTQGLAFHREYQAIIREFERMVSETRERMQGRDMRSPVERWHEALLKAEGLIAETTGLEDDPQFAAQMIVKGIRDRPDTDPLLIKALVNPKAAPPEVTVQDAANLYAQDKGITNKKDSMVRFDRTLRRLTDTLGPLDQMPLKSLRREHGRKLMQVLLGLKKADGSPIALGTAQRDAIIVSALITHGLKEYDLSVEVANPFMRLPWPAEEVQAVNKKLPLPDELIERIGRRLVRGRTEELPLMWRLLKGTGMRLGEIAGLTQDDLVLNDETPHVLVRPNSVRNLKTASSNRSVPLTGDTLEAAKSAVQGVGGGQPIFSRYARGRGADAASAALMKAVRAETQEKKFTVHGLRHRVSDKLRHAGAPEGVRHGFLGHASEAIAESTYGSPRARLEEFSKWAERAGL
ncbi:site-specific integrase [Yoonia algicola]|uniref:Site-specific integrase n=1 Tax=Yoonia algicola TaxID=3137368 RepID=A0AAN0M310_9RHOB